MQEKKHESLHKSSSGSGIGVCPETDLTETPPAGKLKGGVLYPYKSLGEVQGKLSIRNTFEFLTMLVTVGDHFNSGFGVMLASKLHQEIQRATYELGKRDCSEMHIALHPSEYKILMNTLSSLNFKDVGFFGVQSQLALYIEFFIKIGEVK